MSHPVQTHFQSEKSKIGDLAWCMIAEECSLDLQLHPEDQFAAAGRGYCTGGSIGGDVPQSPRGARGCREHRWGGGPRGPRCKEEGQKEG